MSDMDLEIDATMASLAAKEHALLTLLRQTGYFSPAMRLVAEQAVPRVAALETAHAMYSLERSLADRAGEWWAGFKVHLSDWRIGVIGAVGAVADVILEGATMMAIHKKQSAANAEVATVLTEGKDIFRDIPNPGGNGSIRMKYTIIDPAANNAKAQLIRQAENKHLARIGIGYWVLFGGIIFACGLAEKAVRNTPRAVDNALKIPLPTDAEGYKKYGWELKAVMERDSPFSLEGAFFNDERPSPAPSKQNVEISYKAVHDLIMARTEAATRFKAVPDKLLELAHRPVAQSNEWAQRAVMLCTNVLKAAIEASTTSHGGKIHSMLQRLEQLVGD